MAIIADLTNISNNRLFELIIRYIMNVHKRRYELNTGEKVKKASIIASIIEASPYKNFFLVVTIIELLLETGISISMDLE